MIRCSLSRVVLLCLGRRADNRCAVMVSTSLNDQVWWKVLAGQTGGGTWQEQTGPRLIHRFGGRVLQVWWSLCRLIS